MHTFFILFASTLLLISCGDATQTNESASNYSESSEDSAASKEPLYPFPQYLSGQVAYVDSTPIAVEKIVKINGVTTDSGYIDKAAFKTAMNDFTSIDPNTYALRSQYKEISFQDLSIPSLTFSITTKDETLPLQQADILLNPDTKRVKHVVLNFIDSNGDSTVTKRVLWDHNMKCQIMESIELANGKQYTRITQYIWDKPF
jgi:protein-disulfide isomerase